MRITDDGTVDFEGASLAKGYAWSRYHCYRHYRIWPKRWKIVWLWLLWKVTR